jgi:hypothetical protein
VLQSGVCWRDVMMVRVVTVNTTGKDGVFVLDGLENHWECVRAGGSSCVIIFRRKSMYKRGLQNSVYTGGIRWNAHDCVSSIAR